MVALFICLSSNSTLVVWMTEEKVKETIYAWRQGKLKDWVYGTCQRFNTPYCVRLENVIGMHMGREAANTKESPVNTPNIAPGTAEEFIPNRVSIGPGPQF